jgi:hypothetical protein
LNSLELAYNTCEWDGMKLKVTYEFDHMTECSRNDLIEYLPELDYTTGDDLDKDISVDTSSYSIYSGGSTGVVKGTDERNYSDYEDYCDGLYD